MEVVRSFVLMNFLLLVRLTMLNAQINVIPAGNPVNINGVLEEGEWEDALLVTVQSAGRTIDYRLKHDNEALLIAVDLKNTSSTAVRFPEILLDCDHDKSLQWQPDDWWFHVSATDCEYKGNHSIYDNCEIDHPDWDAVPNFGTAPGAVPIDTIEFMIPLVKLGLQVKDTFGIALDVTNTANSWEFWPLGAMLNSPASWAACTLADHSMGILNDASEVNCRIYPNPASHFLTVDCMLSRSADLTMMIYDMAGRIRFNKHFREMKTCHMIEYIDLKSLGLNAGIYCISVSYLGRNWEKPFTII